MPMPKTSDIVAALVCERCDQSAISPDGSVPCDRFGAIVCDSCRDRDRQPQGETVRLFAPAPNVMPGQLGLGDA